MVAQVFSVYDATGEPAAVAPTRVPLAARENKDANGLPFEALFDARNALLGPIPVLMADAARAKDDTRRNACGRAAEG
jgi:hypothetical protein